MEKELRIGKNNNQTYESQMKVPSIFWVLYDVGDQSDDSSLGKVGQELMISQFTRKIKGKMKIPFNQMVGTL